MGKEYSPFTPGVPLPPELFAGRQSEVEQLIVSCRAAQSGRFERTFVLGERGIGKSSLCRFIRQYADRELGMLGLHVFLGNIETTEDLVAAVFSQLAESSADRPWYGKIKDLLKRHLKEVGLFGVSVKFEASEPELKSLTADFPRALAELLAQLGPDRKGLLLILDDINGLAKSERFANWLKSFVDTVAANHPIPMHFVMSGLPERRASLVELQPSLNRVFALMQTGTIPLPEVRTFFRKAFEHARVTIDDDACEMLAEYSGGYPVLMQEIGDAAYRHDTNGRIDTLDALGGVFGAAEVVGQKYLNGEVVEAIKSDRYRSVLSKLAAAGPFVMLRKDIIKTLTPLEQKVFDNFVRRMKELDVIESARDGEYRFKNQLHWLYYAMQFPHRPPELPLS